MMRGTSYNKRLSKSKKIAFRDDHGVRTFGLEKGMELFEMP